MDNTTTTERQITIELSNQIDKIATQQPQTIFFNANLTAPFFEDEDRAPIDLIAVVDVSGSMGSHIGLVKKTLSFMVDQLGSGDSFCMVSFSSGVRVDLDFVVMNGDGKERAKNAVNGLSVGGVTYLSGGLLTGIRKARMRDGDDVNEVCSVLLFTDGAATDGIKDIDKMREAINDIEYSVDMNEGGKFKLRNNGRKRTQKKSKKKIESNETTQDIQKVETKVEDAQKPRDLPFTIYTFGYGESHNSELLRDIAETRDGMYYFIEHADSIADSFSDCLGGLLSIVGQNIQLEIAAVGENEILDALVPYKITTIEEKKKLVLSIGDLQSEESKDILVSVQVPALEVGEQLILEWRLSYFNVLDCEKVETDNIPQVMQVSVDVDDAVVNEHVIRQKYRAEVSRTLKSSASLKKEGQREEGMEIIKAKIEELEGSQMSNDSFLLDLIEDLNDVLEDLKMNQTYQLNSKMGMHSRQRNAQGSAGKSRYATNKKVMMKMKNF